MALEAVKWKDTRKTPERLARKARPNLSESVLADPGREERRSVADLVNILSGLPGAEVALGKGLVGLGGLGVIKGRGGNWLSGSVEGALRGLRREGYNDINPEVDSLNQWIEGPLTKYVKTRMASPEDEVRKLAEQGVLHFEPPVGFNSRVVGKRKELGYPEMGMGKSQLAQSWEGLSDTVVNAPKAEIYQNFGSSNMTGQPGWEWINKVDPESRVYAFNKPSSYRAQEEGMESLGFPHLIDELSNALNPASGPPRHLQLTPEAMKQLSMEKAVRRVHEINQFRKAAMEQARLKELETSGMLGTTLREYAENNPMGLRWVEYTRPEKLSEGVTNIAKHGDEYVALGADGQPIAQRLPDGSTGRLATGKTPEDAHLAGQLITEGNIMGHCVGGYCEDVASGRSRIFSLKDKKGEPHVTVEVAPPKVTADIGTFKNVRDMTQEEFEQAAARINSPVRTNKALAESSGWLYRDDAPYWVTEKEFASNIKQIKGKQNRAPNEEYLPFVQDFVRNSPLGSPWSEVGDLGNTGLTKHPTGKYVSDAEANALAARHFGDVKLGNKPGDIENPWQYANRIRRYDPDMLSDADKAFLADWEAGNFAQGGRVEAPAAAWPF